MPTNDFIGFASTGSANIMSQADYAAAAEQGVGMQPGPASSKLANKVWRQGANMAAALGRIAAARGYDALDNGDLNALQSSLDDTISVGTFNRMYFSQTSGSYTAPRTGVYRITLKGGGGGGSYQSLSTYNSWTGAGGGEGGTLIFYKTLTKSQSYAYVIGAGGDAGTGSSDPQSPGKAGGNSSFNSEYTASGGSGAPAAGYSDMGGNGGNTYTAPAGANAFFIPGQTGQSSYHFLPSALPNEGYPVKSVSGGGQTARYNQPLNNFGEGGNGGGTANPTAGGSGFILIEYAG